MEDVNNNKKYIVKEWANMVLNSTYGIVPIIPIEYDDYDEYKAQQITEEGKKNIKMIQDVLKTVL